MPILRLDDKHIYFAHIPKCGGSSVEDALSQAGFSLSFLDRDFYAKSGRPWTRTSPQHILEADLAQLFDKQFFHYQFAVVRDPVSRFLSAYNFNRNKIGIATSLKNFIAKLKKRNSKHNDYFGANFDNHFVPAVRFVSSSTHLFPLSGGLEGLFYEFNRHFGTAISPVYDRNVGDYANPRFGQRGIKLAIKKAIYRPSPRAENIDGSIRRQIAELYHDDIRLVQFAEENAGHKIGGSNQTFTFLNAS